MDIAIGIRSRIVAGMEPEIPQRFRRGLGIVVVGRQHCVGPLWPHQDLADFTRGDWLVAVIGYDHVEGFGIGLATGADPAALTWRRHRDNARFCCAIDLDDPAVEATLESLVYLGEVEAARWLIGIVRARWLLHQ